MATKPDVARRLLPVRSQSRSGSTSTPRGNPDSLGSDPNRAGPHLWLSAKVKGKRAKTIATATTPSETKDTMRWRLLTEDKNTP